jgi:membrane protein
MTVHVIARAIDTMRELMRQIYAVRGCYLCGVKQLLPKPLITAWNTFVEFVDITDRRHIFLLASGIAFNQLLTFIPSVLVAIGVASALVSEVTVKANVKEWLLGMLPRNGETEKLVTTVVSELHNVLAFSETAGWTSGFILVWTASALFSSIRTGLNAIFHIPTPKFFLVYKVKDLILTIVMIVLVVVATAASPLISLAQNADVTDILRLSPDIIGFLRSTTLQLLGFLGSTILFFFLYWIVPNKRLPWLIVLISTGLAVLMTEAAAPLFSWYLTSATRLGVFYGGYLTIVAFALWLYYSSLIFLLSAEVAQFVYVKVKEHHAPAP